MKPTHQFTASAPSDLHIRLIARAILNGQFDGLPIGRYSKVDWVEWANWFADVQGEPEDEAQAIAEFELMLARVEVDERFRNLPEREQYEWVDRENYFDARGPWRAALEKTPVRTVA